MRLKKMRQITMLSRKFQFDNQVLLVTSKKIGDFFQVNIHVGLNKGRVGDNIFKNWNLMCIFFLHFRIKPIDYLFRKPSSFIWPFYASPHGPTLTPTITSLVWISSPNKGQCYGSRGRCISCKQQNRSVKFAYLFIRMFCIIITLLGPMLIKINTVLRRLILTTVGRPS